MTQNLRNFFQYPLFLFLTIALLLSGASAWATNNDTWTDIIPGVTHLHRTTNVPRPLNIHVLVVDVTNPRVRVGTLTKNDYPGPDGGERTSGMASRNNALAAINCDYFSSGTVEDHIPQGISIQDGFKIPVSGHVTNRLSWVMDGASLESVMEVFATTHPYTPPSWMFQAASGGPRLVRNGVVSIENTSGLPSAYVLHPRTAMGISQDRKTLYLAVVDGRQTGFSEGMTGPELGNLLISLGAWDAMNFDSGGSSTFYLNGQVRNKPSDGSERRVANALAIFDTANPGPVTSPTLSTGFEAPEYTTGLINGQNGWTGSAVIQNQHSNSVNQALLVNNMLTERTFNVPTDKVQWIDFKAKRIQGFGQTIISFGKSASEVMGMVRFNSDGRLGVFIGFGTGFGAWSNLFNYNLDQWYRFSIRLDYNDNVRRFNVYIDDRLITAGVLYRDPGAAQGLGWLMMADSGSGSLIVDDLYIGPSRFDHLRLQPRQINLPSGAASKFEVVNQVEDIQWSIYDERTLMGASVAPGTVAEIDETGLLTTKNPGSFIVRATGEWGRQAETARIVVTPSSTIGELHQLSPGTQAGFGSAVVTGVFTDHLYAQQEDRAAGIRINTNHSAAAGDRINATGTVGVSNNEKVFNPTTIWTGYQGDAAVPLTMHSRAAYRASSTEQPGLNPTGLLVSVAGRVTKVESGVFFINDGGIDGDGIPVIWQNTDQITPGGFVAVTGPLGVFSVGQLSYNAVKPVSSGDIISLD